MGKLLNNQIKPGVVFFGTDLFRCNTNKMESVANLRNMIFRLFDYPLRSFGFSPAWFAPKCEGGEFDTKSLMNDMGLPCDRDGWARVCGVRIPDELFSYFERLENASLFIGFGLPFAIGDILTRMQIPFLNLELSPIRFCREYLWAANSNDQMIDVQLKREGFDDSFFYEEASRRRARHALHGNHYLFNDSRRHYGVFAGQMESDLSLIFDGKISIVADHIATIQDVFKNCDEIVFSPHPYNENSSSLSELNRHFGNVIRSPMPTYDLLCMDNVEVVSALSSSVTLEARYFEKRAVRLIEPSATIGARMHHIDQRINTRAFWARIFDPSSSEKTARAPLPLSINSIIQMQYGRCD